MKTINFVPLPWGRNPHVQTLLPLIIRRRPIFEPIWQRLNTPDGDFIDLCWTEDPNKTKHKPVVVLFHGLAGSFHSPYANGLLHAFKKEGWLGILMHSRGCSGQPNRKPYNTYHSGEIYDARFMLEYIKTHFPEVPTAAVGVSIGGNMLVRYLAKFKHDPLIKAGCIVSAPLDLGDCSKRIQRGFSKVYESYLLYYMKRSLALKLTRHPNVGHWKHGQKIKFSSLYQYDDTVSAPLSSFKNAHDYYQQSSGISVFNTIRTPLKVIHAKDDPFMTDAVIPLAPFQNNIEYHLTQYGGHVGFVSGSLRKPSFWLEHELPRWLRQHLQ